MTRRSQANPLTIAYMAIGAQRALDKYHNEQRRAFTALCDSYGGQLNIIDAVISHALVADIIGDYIDKLELQVGVWSYEIDAFGFDLVANHFEPVSRPYVADILLDSLSSAGHSRTMLKGALGSLPKKFHYVKGI